MLRSPRLSSALQCRETMSLAIVALLAIGCTPQRQAADPPPRSAMTTSAPASAAATVAASAVTPAATGDAELSRFLPAGATLRMSARGDLDGDGDEDALIAVESSGTGASSAPRSLYLLRRAPDGALKPAVESSNAILCRTCGGMMGDPLQAIRIERGAFTLRFEGGSRELWSSEYRFEYTPDRDDWRLASITFGGFDRADGRNAERTQRPADFGDVPLADFDPQNHPADALP